MTIRGVSHVGAVSLAMPPRIQDTLVPALDSSRLYMHLALQNDMTGVPDMTSQRASRKVAGCKVMNQAIRPPAAGG